MLAASERGASRGGAIAAHDGHASIGCGACCSLAGISGPSIGAGLCVFPCGGPGAGLRLDRIVIYGYLSGLLRPERAVNFFRQVVGVPVLSKEVLSQHRRLPGGVRRMDPTPGSTGPVILSHSGVGAAPFGAGFTPAASASSSRIGAPRLQE